MAAAGLLGFAAPAAAVSVITFENLPGMGGAIPDGYGASPEDGIGVPAGFGGFTWSPPAGSAGEPIAAVDWTLFPHQLNPPGDPTGFVTGASSGTTTAFNSVSVGGTGVAYITLIPAPGYETFDFLQASWTGGFGPQTLTLEGWHGGTLLHETAFPVTRHESFVSALDWTGLDRLVIRNSAPDAQWVMDDLMFRSGPPIPEPATWALLAAGLALVAARAARRRA